MTIEYWQEREDEILAFRDYALSFDLRRDVTEGVWLAESGDQLLEIAFQLFFIGYSNDSLRLVDKAIKFFVVALNNESSSPMTDPAMAHVYHGLYYARWWITDQEPTGLLRQAAVAFSSKLGQPAAVDDADAYVRSAWLWLELGETTQVDAWLRLAEWAEQRSGGSSADSSLLRDIVACCKPSSAAHVESCVALDEAIVAASAWGTPVAGTLWDALQLANIRRRFVRREINLRDLLTEIR